MQLRGPVFVKAYFHYVYCFIKATNLVKVVDEGDHGAKLNTSLLTHKLFDLVHIIVVVVAPSSDLEVDLGKVFRNALFGGLVLGRDLLGLRTVLLVVVHLYVRVVQQVVPDCPVTPSENLSKEVHQLEVTCHDGAVRVH